MRADKRAAAAAGAEEEAEAAEPQSKSSVHTKAMGRAKPKGAKDRDAASSMDSALATVIFEFIDEPRGSPSIRVKLSLAPEPALEIA